LTQKISRGGGERGEEREEREEAAPREAFALL
jgi:hypothetical protein